MRIMRPRAGLGQSALAELRNCALRARRQRMWEQFTAGQCGQSPRVHPRAVARSVHGARATVEPVMTIEGAAPHREYMASLLDCPNVVCCSVPLLSAQN